MTERGEYRSPVPGLYFLATVLGAIGFYITSGWVGVLFVLATSFGVAALGIWMKSLDS